MVVACDSCWSSARANGLNLVEPNEDFSTVVTCKDTTARLEKTSCRTGVKKRISCYGRRQITAWKRGRWTCLSGKTGKTRFVVQGAKVAVMMQQRKLPEVKQSNIRTMDWYTDQLQPTGRAWCLPWYLTHHGAMRQNTTRKTTETQRSKGTHNHFGKPRFNLTSFHIYIISWQSTIIRRVCRNTLQAETCAMSSAVEEGLGFRAILTDIHRSLESVHH